MFNKANRTATQSEYYRSRNTRYSARAEVQRQLVGPLRALVGLHAEQWRVDTLAGPSQLALDRAAGLDLAIGRNVGDVAGRVGLGLDPRDSEAAPTRGGVNRLNGRAAWSA